MFFPFARLRVSLLSFFLYTALTLAREDTLFTSSVTYCEPPETLLVQQFDVAYFAKNQSVSFNISAASVQANVNVTANLLVNVYGIRAVNVTLDLCNIFGGALCPLPMYNFIGSDSISLPKSLGVQDKIPGIAFKIPDLEGVAQLVLTEVDTGKVKACVQATLSNGWSTHQPSVEWITGGIALVTLLLSIWHSLSPDTVLPFRLIDLLFLYQTIASTSFLNLNYPSTYRAFTLNFAWAMGLFSTSQTSTIQPSIDQMRYLTGGKLANATSASAIGLVNRKLSPYNLGPNTHLSSVLNRRETGVLELLSLSSIFSSGAPVGAAFHQALSLPSATQGGDVQTVTTSSSNILQAGIPIYVNTLHIATANAFMTIFLYSLILTACALGIFISGFALVYALGHFKPSNKDLRARTKAIYMQFVRAWALRLALFLLFPIIVFSFYQWTLKDSWLSILLSVIAFLVLVTAVLYPSLLVLGCARRNGRDVLYKDSERLTSNGPLYGQYRISRFYFFLPLLAASILKAIFIAFAASNGEAQIILMVILEGFTVILYLVLRPYKTGGGDIFSTFLAVIRLVCTGLMIAFLERLNVPPIPRVAIGLVIAVIFSVTILIACVNLILHSGIHRLWRHDRTQLSDQSQSLNASILEKGENSITNSPSSSELHVLRPRNPTPDSSDQQDTGFLQPFPVSPTETELTSAYASNRTSGTGTITVGSLLPRRWSFSPLNSPTDSSQTDEPASHASQTNLSSTYFKPALQHGQEHP